jgi:hypothetical protein
VHGRVRNFLNVSQIYIRYYYQYNDRIKNININMGVIVEQFVKNMRLKYKFS